MSGGLAAVAATILAALFVSERALAPPQQPRDQHSAGGSTPLLAAVVALYLLADGAVVVLACNHPARVDPILLLTLLTQAPLACGAGVVFWWVRSGWDGAAAAAFGLAMAGLAFWHNASLLWAVVSAAG